MPSTTAVAAHTNGGFIFSTNPMIERAQSQWLFTPSELLKSPSILEGMPAAQEMANRQKGVNFITQIGIMLKLPQMTLATASVFLHRFYMRHPMQISKDKGIHHYQVAATALFLATKVEENCRKMRELIVACCRVAQKQPNLVVDEQSKEYWKWRDTILHNEDLLLEALCFDLQLEQSYRMLYEILCYYGVQDHKNLRNTSWAFLNDSNVTTLCLLFPPKTIAGSALYAGVKMTGATLSDDEQGRPWWQHLDLDIFDIQKACNVMADVYENPALPRHGQKEAYLREDDIMSFDRTRRTQSPSVDRSPGYSQRSASQGLKREREDSWGHEQRTGHTDGGAPSQGSAGDHAHSPKRLRTDSQSNGDHTRTSRVPSIAESLRMPLAPGGVPDDTRSRDGQSTRGSHIAPDDRLVDRNGQPRSNAPQHGPRERDSNDSIRSSANGAQASMANALSSQLADRGDTRYNDTDSGYVRTNVLDDNAEEVDYGSEEGEV